MLKLCSYLYKLHTRLFITKVHRIVGYTFQIKAILKWILFSPLNKTWTFGLIMHFLNVYSDKKQLYISELYINHGNSYKEDAKFNIESGNVFNTGTQVAAVSIYLF